MPQMTSPTASPAPMPMPHMTNFPYGPVPLSQTWTRYKEMGLKESDALPTAVDVSRGYLDGIMCTPTRISPRSKKELMEGPIPPTQATKMVEILPDRLYFMTMPDLRELRVDPPARSCYYYFTTDKSLVYLSFSQDFGPLNLSQTVRFIRRLITIIHNPDHSKCRIVYYCPDRPDRITNCLTLMAIFLQEVCRYDIGTILSVIEPIGMKPYRDASYGACYYKMNLQDILESLIRAKDLAWWDWKTFNVKLYEKYEAIDNGDLNWIIPNKFVAFSSPMMHRVDTEGYISNTPDDYIPVFQQLGVTDIVQLNDNVYDREVFIDAGYKHHVLTYPDGSVPPDYRIDQFLKISEESRGVIAVHCKAGLGRTGSMIGIYAIRNYGFTGREWIAWNRLSRPGSVLGPQQQWLSLYEHDFRRATGVSPQVPRSVGDIACSPRAQGMGVRSPVFPSQEYSMTSDYTTSTSPQQQLVDAPASRTAILDSILVKEQRKIAVEGDIGQAERLVHAKRQHEGGHRVLKKSSSRTHSIEDSSTSRHVRSPDLTESSNPDQERPGLGRRISSFIDGIRSPLTDRKRERK